MTIDRRKIRWNGWGWADHEDASTGNEAVWSWIAENLGMGVLMSTPARDLQDIELPASRIAPDLLGKLQTIAGTDFVKTDKYERAFHARGKSYHDLLYLRSGDIRTAPDAVLYPSTEQEVMDLLAVAKANNCIVIPYGGGSSVVGGVNAPTTKDDTPILTLDLTLMNRVLSIDEEAMTATVQPGIYGPHLEAQLQERGFTLGHYPQSFEFSTLGGWIAARGAGQQSNRYGKAEKWLVSLRMATLSGVWATEGFPASAAGPNLNQLALGSEGTMGIITEATVRISKVPLVKDYRGYLVKDFETGTQIIRRLCQMDVPMAMARLSDPDETYFFQAFSAQGKKKTLMDGVKSIVQQIVLKSRGLADKPCLFLVGLEGDYHSTAYASKRVKAAIKEHGAMALGTGPGKKWYHGRFSSPYSRDPMMDHALGIDTLETSTRWSNIETLYAAVREAIDHAIRETAPKPGAHGLIMTHVSHSYKDGASLYFTFVFPRNLESEVEQWRTIKNAATEAIVANGGTITHHHGVGTDHTQWMSVEKGEIGMDLLKSIKQEIDPDGIMNPGKLIDP